MISFMISNPTREWDYTPDPTHERDYKSNRTNTPHVLQSRLGDVCPKRKVVRYVFESGRNYTACTTISGHTGKSFVLEFTAITRTPSACESSVPE